MTPRRDPSDDDGASGVGAKLFGRSRRGPDDAASDPESDATENLVQPTEAPRATQSVWTTINRPFSVGFFLTIGALLAVALGTAVSSLSLVWIYVVFALFAALGLDPIVRWLRTRGVRRGWGIAIVYTGFAAGLAAIIWLIIPPVIDQVVQFFQDIPSLINDLENSSIFVWADDTFGDQLGDLVNQAEAFLIDPANLAAIGGGVFEVGVTIATTISGLLIVIVLSLYFLASLPTMKANLVRLVPERNRNGVREMTTQITESVGGYITGMVFLAFLNAVTVLILHLVIGLPFPALMALLAFVITLIPLIGPVLFLIIGTLLALFHSPVSALFFGVIYFVYIQVEAYVLTPRVMNRTISVPGSLVVIGALIGGTLLGLLGALVAIPVTASILLVIKQVIIPRQDRKT